jgi:hypothetical protein
MVVYLLMLVDIRGVYSAACVRGKFGSTRGARIDLDVITLFLLSCVARMDLIVTGV